MKGLFDISTDDLITSINFISKVCAGELGEINILPTDRIISSVMADYSTEAIWTRMRKKAVGDQLKIMNSGYKRAYGINLKSEDIDFRIYISANLTNTSVGFMERFKYTKDDGDGINIIMPDIAYMEIEDHMTKDQCIFLIIRNIFLTLFRAISDYRDKGSVEKSFMRYLSIILALFTGLFPTNFVPVHVSPEIVYLAEKMYNDSSLVTKSKDGHMIILCRTGSDEELFFNYLDQIMELSED